MRLLLRFGDECEEREQAVAGRFRIVPGAAPAPVFRRRVPAPGEAARPGGAGVVLWAEGARDGSGWREVEGRSTPQTCAPGYQASTSFAAAAEEPELERPAAARSEGGVLRSTLRAGVAGAPPAAATLVQSLLLLLHRLNR